MTPLRSLGMAIGVLLASDRALAGDHDWLHLEARYNYETLETGSVWVGCNLSGGENWSGN